MFCSLVYSVIFGDDPSIPSSLTLSLSLFLSLDQSLPVSELCVLRVSRIETEQFPFIRSCLFVRVPIF